MKKNDDGTIDIYSAILLDQGPISVARLRDYDRQGWGQEHQSQICWQHSALAIDSTVLNEEWL
ncbi:MAG: hypothetical protein ABFS45_06350 [Pseudomonadota bacterium]